MLKCKDCKFKRNVPGDTHISCVRSLNLLSGISNHGVKNGWFMYPYNFDPIWADFCTGYIDKSENLDLMSNEELKKAYFFELYIINLYIKKACEPHIMNKLSTFANYFYDPDIPKTSEEYLEAIKIFRMM